jgi:hypothetical protein
MKKTRAVTVHYRSNQEFFRKYLEAAKSLFYIKDSGLDVLAELLYWNDRFKMLPKKDRDKITFNYDTKISIMENLGMSKQVLDNTLTYLRKNNIIIGNSISPKYEFFKEDGENQLIFIFKEQEDVRD